MGQTGFVHTAVQDLLQVSFMLCMSVLSYNYLGSSMLLYLHLRHIPFFRGSELKYYHADKMHTMSCRQNQAHKAPAAKS